MQEGYIMSGTRTAIGDFRGALKDFWGHQLVVHPLEEAIKRPGIGKERVEEVIFGHCIQSTDEPNPAQIAITLLYEMACNGFEFKSIGFDPYFLRSSASKKRKKGAEDGD